jgi:hypothetical protein
LSSDSEEAFNDYKLENLADAARRDDPALRAVFITAIQYYLDQLATLLSANPGAARNRPPAAILSEMVGAVILSRVAADAPRAESLIAAVSSGYRWTLPVRTKRNPGNKSDSMASGQ